MFKNICFFLFVFSSLLGATQPAADPAGYLPIAFYNNSQLLSSSEVYILVKGIDPITKKNCYVSFDPATGIGSCVDALPAMSSYTYSYPIALFPKNSYGRVVYLPQVDSGRIYVSLNYPLDLLVDPVSHNILDPDALNTNDPNYYVLYDKIEFTYTIPGNPEIDFNPTAVDFFCLPLYLQLITSSKTQASGFLQSRAFMFSKFPKIFANYDKTPNKVWNNLIIPFVDPLTQTEITQLRIASTSKAMTTSPVLFDPNYLSNSTAYGFDWIQDVWSTYYQTHTLSIDCTELAPPNNQIFVGQVNQNNQFVFTGASGSPTVEIDLPTNSYPFFGAAGETFSESNRTPQAIIVRDLTSAFITGLLPTASTNVLNHKFFANNKANYFTVNSLLPTEGKNSGPWYDLYSKALHSFNNNIYTFAYDDLLGIDGTVTANVSDSPNVVITLCDLRGTTVPDPFTDPTLYTITVKFSPSNPVSYQGQPLKNNQVLTNVSMPFSVELMGNDKQTYTANIYIKYPQVRPTFPGATGIKIKKQGNEAATIVFPGA